jgi:hypothetical protein
VYLIALFESDELFEPRAPHRIAMDNFPILTSCVLGMERDLSEKYSKKRKENVRPAKNQKGEQHFLPCEALLESGFRVADFHPSFVIPSTRLGVQHIRRRIYSVSVMAFSPAESRSQINSVVLYPENE